MYRGYKIKAYIPAGRRQYMELLMPQLYKLDYIDEIMILKNTSVPEDCEFIDNTLKECKKVHLYTMENASNEWKYRVQIIGKFYQYMCDEDTIYIKFDDDLVYIHKDAIKTLLDYRIDNPQYFVVYPLIINNAYCLWRLAKNGKCDINEKANNQSAYHGASDDYLYHDGEAANKLHMWFIENYLSKDKVSELYINNEEIVDSRASINCIAWFGKDMKDACKYMYLFDDEEYISRAWPNKTKRKNALVGNAVVAHFAFTPQREKINEKELLEEYKKYID